MSDQTPTTSAPRGRAARMILLGLITALLACGTALLGLSLREVAAPTGVRLPWWALAGAFVLVESCVVHVHFRRSAHSFTLGEIPLLLGLFFAQPFELMLAWGLAGGIVLAAQRTPAPRLIFNVFLLAFTAGLAAVVFSALAPAASVQDPRAWAAGLSGSLLSALAVTLLIALAVSVYEHRVPLARLRHMLAMSVAVAATNACLGLAIAVVIGADPKAGLLLLVPAAVLLVAYRAYAGERQKHASLEFLYEVTRGLAAARDTPDALVGVLSRVNSTFRGEIAEAYLFDSPAGRAGRTALGPDDRVDVMQPIAPGIEVALRELLGPEPRGLLLPPGAAPNELSRQLAAHGVVETMVAPVVGEAGLLGAIVVGAGNRVGGSFSHDELHLLEALARHTGATIENGRLGRQVAELHQLQRRLEHQAFHDPLTGLANRLLFSDRVVHALNRRGGQATVMYIDLDDFKTVNDTLGHDAGDALLVQTAERLTAALRPSDTAARLGGDEFAVLLTDITEENARKVAERILTSLRRPVIAGGREVPVHASLGIAGAASGSLPADELLRNADAAMYAAKHGGKRGLAVYGAPAAAPALAAA